MPLMTSCKLFSCSFGKKIRKRQTALSS